MSSNSESEAKKICLSPIATPTKCSSACAQYITQLALHNEVGELREYLAAARDVNPYVVVPFDHLIKLTIEGYDTESEMANLIEYLLREQTEEHAHYDDTTKEGGDTYSKYCILPYYFIIFHADWILPEVISLILQAKVVDPLEIHKAVRVTNNSIALGRWSEGLHYFDSHIKGVTLLTSLYQSTHRTSMRQLLEMSPALISSQFPTSSFPFEWCGLSLLGFFLIYAASQYMEEQPRRWNYVLEGKVEWNSFLKDNCLFPIKVLKPLLELGFDINSNGSSVFNHLCKTKGITLNLFSTFISNGLMDFSTLELESPAIAILSKACHSWYGARKYQLEKATLLLQLLHSLGAFNKISTAQIAREVDFISMLNARNHSGLDMELWFSLIDDSKHHAHGAYIAHNQMVAILTEVGQRRANPLRLRELTRSAVRNAVGGRWFASKVAQLLLPRSLKAFIQAHLSREFDELDSNIDEAVRLTG